MVTPDAFRRSLAESAPPENLSDALQSLWWAGKADWDKAHRIVMESSGAEAAWVHAYLHRVEGDLGNAAYWYRAARRPPADGPLPDEWDAIVGTLLSATK